MGRNDLPGDDQHMHRRLWVNVFESQTLLVLVNDVRRDLPIDDLQKDVVLQHDESPPGSVFGDDVAT